MNQTRLDLSGGAGSGPLVPSQEIVTYAGDNAVELFQLAEMMKNALKSVDTKECIDAMQLLARGMIENRLELFVKFGVVCSNQLEVNKNTREILRCATSFGRAARPPTFNTFATSILPTGLGGHRPNRPSSAIDNPNIGDRCGFGGNVNADADEIDMDEEFIPIYKRKSES